MDFLSLASTPTCTHTHTHTHTPLLVKLVNWGYLYMPIQTGTFECGYTLAYWGYTKYECDYTPITWGYPNTPSIGDMLLNAFIWHFRSHAGNAQMGTSPVGSVSTFPLAESDVCPRFTPFTNAHTHTHTHPPTYTHNKKQAKQKTFLTIFVAISGPYGRFRSASQIIPLLHPPAMGLNIPRFPTKDAQIVFIHSIHKGFLKLCVTLQTYCYSA